MSYQDFDCDYALNLIKATFYDISENQERIIGSLEDEEERNIQIGKYIKMKDTATTLIEEIEHLYPKHKRVKKVDNNKEVLKKEEHPKVVEVNPTLEPNDEKDAQIEEVEEKSRKQDDMEENNLVVKEDGSKQEDDLENTEDLEETFPIGVEEKEDKNQADLTFEKKDNLKNEKFLLDDRNGTRPNFAYVPPNLFEIIKKKGITVLENQKLIFYKTDKEHARGIIVRSDQFMKLSLSKHRQEGILEEARLFRINEAKKRQEQALKEDKEKMNAKVKALKIA